ncbi:MAG: MBL fold metallo-hydrolase [Synechococcales cyanobacterium RM1_1_8]|nr:MBL fold metallo-hydrolase [Synechococcales cyanobacterium RM1_1_8]
MKRRQFLFAASAGVGAIASSSLLPHLGQANAQTPGLAIRYLGHSCFVFQGDGQEVMVNPFRKIGCTQGYAAPQVDVDLVMISSRLFDEGYVEDLPGDPRILFQPGVYQLGNQQIQGIRTDHDRVQGRRFGVNVAWNWTQGGIKVLHLGGAAAPITVEQKILMGTPDVLLVPVSGGPKAYTPEEAMAAIQVLNPKLVIPTQYRTAASDAATCPVEAIDAFLAVAQGMAVERIGNQMTLQPGSLPSGPVVRVMNYA